MYSWWAWITVVAYEIVNMCQITCELNVLVKSWTLSLTKRYMRTDHGPVKEKPKNRFCVVFEFMPPVITFICKSPLAMPLLTRIC